MVLKNGFKDLSGNIYGRLTAIEFHKRDSIKKNTFWVCKCECGNTLVVNTENLRVGNTKSCGCLQKESVSKANKTHGLRNTPEYSAWAALKGRCLNKNNGEYHRYGARGITVCDRWLDSFENFYADMGKKPSSNLSIDRINNNKGYSKENCRWATSSQQARNRNTENFAIGIEGETNPMAKMSDLEVMLARIEKVTTNITVASLARKYNVAHITMTRIVKGQMRNKIIGDAICL